MKPVFKFNSRRRRRPQRCHLTRTTDCTSFHTMVTETKHLPPLPQTILLSDVTFTFSFRKTSHVEHQQNLESWISKRFRNGDEIYWLPTKQDLDCVTLCLRKTSPFLQRVSIACYAERCISHDRFCLTVRPSDRLTV